MLGNQHRIIRLDYHHITGPMQVTKRLSDTTSVFWQDSSITSPRTAFPASLGQDLPQRIPGTHIGPAGG